MTPNTFTFYYSYFGSVVSVLSPYTTTKSAAVASAVQGVFTTMLTVYVILWGISVAYGKIQEPLVEGIFRLLRILAITGCAFGTAYYAGTIASMPLDLANGIASQMTTDPAADPSTSGVGHALDNALNSGFNVGDYFWDAASLSEIGNYFLALIIYACTLVMTLYGGFLTLLSLLGITILVALGPLFISCLLFEQTRRFFDAWLGKLMNYVFLQIIAAAVIGLVVAIFKAAADAATAAAASGTSNAMVWTITVTGLLGTSVLTQVPAMSSGLAGGATLGTNGLFAFAMRRVGSAASGIGYRIRRERETVERKPERSAPTPPPANHLLAGWDDPDFAREHYRRDSFLAPEGTAESARSSGLRRIRDYVEKRDRP